MADEFPEDMDLDDIMDKADKAMRKIDELDKSAKEADKYKGMYSAEKSKREEAERKFNNAKDAETRLDKARSAIGKLLEVVKKYESVFAKYSK